MWEPDYETQGSKPFLDTGSYDKPRNLEPGFSMSFLQYPGEVKLCSSVETEGGRGLEPRIGLGRRF